MKLTTDQLEILEQIIAYGKRVNFDFKGMTKESLDQLMRDWLEEGRKFQIKVSETEISIMKRLLKVNM